MSFLQKELVPIEAIRKELRDAEKRRYVHPNYDPELASIWVGWVWDEAATIWQLAGFVRRARSLTAKTVRKARRKLRVPKGATLQLVELWSARVNGPPTTPPRRHLFTTAPDRVSPVSTALRDLGPKRSRRFTRSPERTQVFGKAVAFVASGIPKWERHAVKPTYLGPLMADDATSAIREARELYPMHHVHVHALADMKSSLRRRLRSGALRPGAARIVL